MTDSAISLLIEQFADYYRKYESFPRILLCDDLMIHGRNINFLIKNLSNELINTLDNEYDTYDILDALTDAIHIHVYTRSSDALLLQERYEAKMHFIRMESPAFFYKLSSNIASLILNSDVANATYVVSQHLSNEDFDKLNLDNSFVYTSYQNTEQYTHVNYLEEFSHVKAVATLRILKNKQGYGYRAVPFVFLPNLDETETKLLHNNIITQMLHSKDYTLEDINFLKFLYNQRGMRSYNELLTTIISHTILYEFTKTHNIQAVSSDLNNEIHKISLNFPYSMDYDVENFLNRLIRVPIIKNLETLENIISNSLSLERTLFSCSDNASIHSDEQILDELEAYIYEQGYQEEKNAFLISEQHFSNPVERSIRRVRGCGFLLRDLASNKNYASVSRLIAYFLQMMDAGVLTLSSLAGSKIRVVGFSQFVKAGEQSLLLLPLKVMEYIPLMTKIYQYCEQRGKQFSRELANYYNSGFSHLDKSIVTKLLNVYHSLEQIGRTPEDWNSNFLSKLELKKDVNEQIHSNLEFVLLQEKHVKRYEFYLKSEEL